MRGDVPSGTKQSLGKTRQRESRTKARADQKGALLPHGLFKHLRASPSGVKGGWTTPRGGLPPRGGVGIPVR